MINFFTQMLMAVVRADREHAGGSRCIQAIRVAAASGISELQRAYASHLFSRTRDISAKYK